MLGNLFRYSIPRHHVRHNPSLLLFSHLRCVDRHPRSWDTSHNVTRMNVVESIVYPTERVGMARAHHPSRSSGIPAAIRERGRQRRDIVVSSAFDFAFQPIVDIRTGVPYAYEALIRGPRGESAGNVLAGVALPLRYHFDQAIRERAFNAAMSLGLSTRLSINCLPNALLRHDRNIQRTVEAAEASGMSMRDVIFEIVEDEHIDDQKALAHVFRAHRDLGFKTALDDFGAGYASLSLLADLHPDIVKVDIALVKGVDIDTTRQKIVRGALAICRDLGIEIIAEGVETTGERDFFASEGVTLMQGFLFARPAMRALPLPLL
ncbi:EAL domain-containing protein [Pararobbsia silviterrae]|uniref:EAL domain-containing protein n=2 Tax=Pararobbsia silviterrae TaxID=1792498 RepID=A0A494XSI4_9BURK|nr:EAL domain-containing protein [Pararobbsia silviterrae]